MKSHTYKLILTLFSLFLIAGNVFAQTNRSMQNFRYNDRTGVNVFEAPKDNTVPFEGLKVIMGGAFALQFQGLDHENSDAVPLMEIGHNFNLATANLDMAVALEDGVQMHLRTYLSSRHHHEPYVKAGYFQIDKLDFIEKGFLSNVMDLTTIKIGHMETNYGDAHFRRSDNAMALYNPFVGNYIMDAFTTEVGAEVLVRSNGMLAMLGFTNGKLNQSVDESSGNTRLSLVSKLGYDSQINEDLRVRVTGSIYHTGKSASTYLYAGDRAGGRYYSVVATSEADFRTGRYNPGFANELTSIMFNTFVKYQGLEFFGLYENSTGKTKAVESDSRTWNHFGAELLYRFSAFGHYENFYVGGRYNLAEGEELGTGLDVSIDRINVGGGWFMTKNILAKAEYVIQNYNDFGDGSIYDDAKFDGFMFEAVIGF